MAKGPDAEKRPDEAPRKAQPGASDKALFDSEPVYESTPAARASLKPEERAAIMEGWALLVKGETGPALQRFETALRSNGESVEAHYGQAATLKVMGRTAEAIAAYQKTIEKCGHSKLEDQVRSAMFKHMAESALTDLQAAGPGRPAHYEPPK